MDDENVINKYVEENKFTFQIGMADQSNTGATYDVAKKYGVSAYPTNYLIDASGKVLWRGIGFDENAIREALAKLDLK